jgi:hypothetical protein
LNKLLSANGQNEFPASSTAATSRQSFEKTEKQMMKRAAKQVNVRAQRRNPEMQRASQCGSLLGNILIPAAILFSGNTYKRTVDFARYLTLQFVSSSHYYTTQATILFPVVQHSVTWRTSQNALVKKLKQSDSVDVCGDGRCDSPGHSVKYGTYTLMDEKTNLIIEFSLVQVTEVTSIV